MNKEFMVKIMQAKKLEYEALKSIMPEKMVSRVDKMEKEVIDMAKEFILSELTGAEACQGNSEQKEEKKIKKVTIES